jgi:hypothetical protein
MTVLGHLKMRTSFAALSALGAALIAAAGAGASAGQSTVQATIWPHYVVTLSPKSVAHGKVVFEVKNRETTPQQFSVDGVESSLVPPGGTTHLTVVFKRRGIYSYTLPDYQANTEHGYTSVGGSIKVT